MQMQVRIKESERNYLENLINNKEYCNALIFSNRVIDEIASLENLENGFKLIKELNLLKDEDEKHYFDVLGHASALLLDLKNSAEFFSKSNSRGMLKIILDLALTYGQYEAVDYLKKFHPLENQKMIDFIVNDALPKQRTYRVGDSYILDARLMEAIFNNFYNLPSFTRNDEKKIFEDVVKNMESGGNDNLPLKLLYSIFSEDQQLITKYKSEYTKRKNSSRKNIDALIEAYCKDNNLNIINKIQQGDHNPFYPVVAHIYLVGDSFGEKFVLKEHLKLRLDISKLDGYNKEKQILQSGIRHKNIIDYLETINLDEIQILKFKYILGDDLSKYIKPNNLLPEKEVYRIILELSDTIEYLHQNKIMYMDIKDKNIIYNKYTGEIKLLDFGMAHLLEDKVDDKISVFSVLSTPKYVPPEMGISFRFYKKSEGFMLGILASELLSGAHPFAGYNIKEGDGYRESELIKYSLSNVHNKPDLSGIKRPKVKKFVEKMLNKDYQKRPSLIEIRDFFSKTYQES